MKPQAGMNAGVLVVERWRQAGPALAQVHHDELRELSDAEALACARMNRGLSAISI